jgi:heptosyltransferase II
MKILVRSPNWLGDQVLSYPFFYHLRKAYPSAKITAVCVRWTEEVQFRDLVDDIYVLPKPTGSSLVQKFKAVHRGANELRKKGGWDLAIALPNSISAGWLIFRSGAKRRRGYKADARVLLLNEGVDWDPNPNRHRSQAYVDLLPKEARPDAPAIHFWNNAKFDPKLAWDTGERKLKPPEGPYWVLGPGATAESRRWPVQSFLQLARLIIKETSWKAVIVGGPNEKELAKELRELPEDEKNMLDFTDRGSVTVLSRVFAGAKFTVTNESGLAHVASLCGSPVHIVCGAADPKRTQPIGPGKVNISINAVDCWPCERNTCLQTNEKHLQCLKGIYSNAVWDEIKQEIDA